MIRIIDFETTGLGNDAQVIESAFVDLYDGRAYQKPIEIELGEAMLHSVTMPIDPSARAAHHIWDCDLAGKPAFDERWLYDGLETGDLLAAHNAAYEDRFLVDPCHKLVCTYKAALRVWPNAPSHSNGALAYWLHDQGVIEIDRKYSQPAHRALPDCYVTSLVLKAILETGVTTQQLVLWTDMPAMIPRCPIGEHRGKPWAEVPDGFLRWMLSKDLSGDFKFCAKAELDRRTQS